MNQENLNNKRHTLAHLLAQAVGEIYKFDKVKLTLGPAIENGFYYDIDFGDEKVADKDLAKIEKVMKKNLAKWTGWEQKELSKEEALNFFKNEYKQELINEIAERGEKITTYTCGGFTDLCRGGHTENPSKNIDPLAFKLDRIAGAYWRGDEKNKMLTRIYGLAFETKEELDAYLKQREEAMKRDHRKLGKELDLFTFSEHVGSGLPLYTARGALIRKLLNDYVEELQSKENYMQVWTPQIAKASLFKTSGHYDKYKEDMFRVVSNYSEEEFYLKPMNCPQHTQIYASRPRSYKDLPIRLTDFAMLYRDEQPGQLNGLARVRSFSQDDCHIFCTEEQVDEEIDKALQMTKEIMRTFGFKYKYRLSTRDPKHPEKYLGDPATWDKAEEWAEKIMRRHNIEYVEGVGEASFYAPKMDLIATDALGREWQLSTIQIDYVQPQRFELEYTGKNGEKKSPVMIHRAILGSSERMLMILIENYAGAFPLWLSPVQVKVIPVRESHNDYAKEVYELLREANIRAELATEDENLGGKVRKAKEDKIPYWIVLGDKEVEAGKITLESRDSGQIGQMSKEELVQKLSEEIKNKK